MQDQLIPQTDPGYLQMVVSLLKDILAVGGPAALIIQHILNRRKTQKATEQAEIELRFSLDEFAEIYEQVNELIANTKVDRFLILRAENGSTTPDDTTVLHALPPSKTLIFKGDVNFKLDAYYRDMLVETERNDVFHMQTKKMPEGSRLRKMFDNDGVSHANCYFICKYPSLKDKDKYIILYFMLTTTNPKPFTPNEHTRFGVFADWLKHLLSKEIE